MAGLGVCVFAGLWIYELLTKQTPDDRLVALEKEVKPKGGSIFKTTLLGKPAIFLLLDCTVYLLQPTAEKIERKEVLSTGFYFGLTVCTNQSISKEGEFVKVYLSNQAIGAGGGNITGGYFRSKDGLIWEKMSGEGWKSLDAARQ